MFSICRLATRIGKSIGLISTNANRTKYTYPMQPVIRKHIPHRSDPIVTKLDSTEFRSIFNESLDELIALFKRNGYEIRIAGGAVRDLLLHKCPTDIDFATVATPTEMKAMFEANQIRMVNVNGEKHGTVTPRIKNAQFEVTTLRIDEKTNGRLAEVTFTTDWMLDASRRDLTINSMFCDFDGNVYDHFFGYDDLLANRVVFVGDAEQRIREDYLRILRYFRFYGRVAVEVDRHDPATLTAIERNVDGLAKMSGERVWGELRKILSGNFVEHLMMTLLECGAAKYIGFISVPNIEEFHRVCVINEKCTQSMRPITLLSSLVNSAEEALSLNSRFKFSVPERDLMKFIVTNAKRFARDGTDDLNYYQEQCFNTLGRAGLQREFIVELLKYNGQYRLAMELHDWIIPKFPISGSELSEKGLVKGVQLGRIKKRLQTIWIKSSFSLSADELLHQHLPEILATEPKPTDDLVQVVKKKRKSD